MLKVFPEMINELPEVKIPLDGLRIHISQADNHEIWFLETDVDIDYPAHAHTAQWSVVLEGKIEVMMNGNCNLYEKGDRYFLPEGVEHSVKMHAGYAELIFLNDQVSKQF